MSWNHHLLPHSQQDGDWCLHQSRLWFKWNSPHFPNVSRTHTPHIQYLCSWVMHFIIAFAMKPLGRRQKETTLNGSNVCSGGKRRFSLKPFHCIKYPVLVTHLSSGLSVFPAPCHDFHCIRCTWVPQPLWKWTHECSNVCEIRPVWQKKKKKGTCSCKNPAFNLDNDS